MRAGLPLAFACFSCRKCFKRPQFFATTGRFLTSTQKDGQLKEQKAFDASRVYRCPDCGDKAHFMGLDFKAPKRSNIREWRAVAERIACGKVFTRGVGSLQVNMSVHRTAYGVR